LATVHAAVQNALGSILSWALSWFAPEPAGGRKSGMSSSTETPTRIANPLVRALIAAGGTERESVAIVWTLAQRAGDMKESLEQLKKSLRDSQQTLKDAMAVIRKDLGLDKNE
jgi:hypothetical protein